MKSAIKDMADSLFFWGVAKVQKYGKAVSAANWQDVSEKKKKTIDKALSAIAKKIVKMHGKEKPALKTKLLFHIMRLLQKKGWNKTDMDYWQERGWTEKIALGNNELNPGLLYRKSL